MESRVRRKVQARFGEGDTPYPQGSTVPTLRSDMHYNQPRWCKHQLAMFLSQRVLSLMHQPPAPVIPPEPAPAVAPQSPAVETERVSQPLPEARASANVRVQVAGREVQWTLRDHDEARLAGRLEALLARYPLPQPAAQTASQLQGEGWCAVHNVEMRWNEGKDGRKGWYSHRTDDGWCKGK